MTTKIKQNNTDSIKVDLTFKDGLGILDLSDLLQKHGWNCEIGCNTHYDGHYIIISKKK